MQPKGYVSATITARDDFADDLATFWLRPDEPVRFEPGQYATLALEIKGKLVKRAYSIASPPHETDLEFYVECVEDGVLTPCLWDLRPGDTLWMRRKIVGHFTLDAARTEHVMAATVTGLAPFLSVVLAQRHALAAGTHAGPVHRFLVLHGASVSQELGPYRSRCEALAEALDWFDYVPTISRPWKEPGWAGETGRVEELLRKWLDRVGFDPAETAGYACGNPQMIENAKGILARARLAEDAIHEEKYFTTPAAEAVKEAPTAAPVTVPKPKPPSMRKPPPGAMKLKAVKHPPG